MKLNRHLLVSALSTFGTAFISQLTSTRGVDIAETYAKLKKPPWAPPASAFGPVWLSLYALLSGATAMVASSKDPRAKSAVALYRIQLIANGLWTPLFFKYNQQELAELDVIIVTGLLMIIAVRYAQIRPIAGLMVLPAVAWCTLATALTHDIRVRNLRES